MNLTDPNADGRSILDDPRLCEDPELISALFSMLGKLEISEQQQALIEPLLAWSGVSGSGFGLGVSGGSRRFTLVASSTPLADPRFESFVGVERELLKSWLADGRRLFDGLGPFSSFAEHWIERRPECTLALPLRGNGQEWAGATLLMLENRPQPQNVERMEKLFDLARPAVSNALQVLALRELVIKDDTAQCFNRRHFEECLPEELSRASRFRTPLSLIFLDMDNLKQVNNRFGHSMGSSSLREVSVRMRAKIRKFDKLFRFGGDEFCIVLPETEWHGAMEVAERVRDAICSKPFLARELDDRRGVPMSASLGIASYPLHARNQRDLVQQADRAMQQIKNSGKNGIGIAEIAGERNGG